MNGNKFQFVFSASIKWKPIIKILSAHTPILTSTDSILYRYFLNIFKHNGFRCSKREVVLKDGQVTITDLNSMIFIKNVFWHAELFKQKLLQKNQNINSFYQIQPVLSVLNNQINIILYNIKNNFFLKMLGWMEKYKILDQIHKSQYSILYSGLQIETNEEVAIKIALKNTLDQFDLNEIKEQCQLLQKINHPNIISIKEIIQTTQQLIIVTPFAGENLKSILQKQKNNLYVNLKDICLEIIDVMIYLNQNRIIHRNLTPFSILLKDNRIKICNFKWAEEQGPQNKFSGNLVVSPPYLAPQMVQNKYDYKTDVWSLGCTIYQLFTKRTPFTGSNLLSIAMKVSSEQVNYPQQIPSDIKDLISCMLKKDPKQRLGWKGLKDHKFFKPNNS